MSAQIGTLTGALLRLNLAFARCSSEIKYTYSQRAASKTDGNIGFVNFLIVFHFLSVVFFLLLFEDPGKVQVVCKAAWPGAESQIKA